MINEVKNYIENNYNIEVKIIKNYKDEDIVFLQSEKYDIEIGITPPENDNYLQGKFGISFNYNANKKYRSELSYHGGGYLVEYKLTEIDKFLEDFDIKKEKQLTIFDMEVKE